MILYKLTFGPVTRPNRDAGEDVADGYIAALLHNGQVCGQYLFAVQGGALCAYFNVPGVRAHARKNHSVWGLDELEQVTAHFGAAPTWELLDEWAPKRETTWGNAPFLYLSTSIIDRDSPLCRGDNGKPIPLYRIPGTDRDRSSAYSWQGGYRDYDSLWLASGELEITAYKQLAVPDSALSRWGRELCTWIEKAIDIPTYYYLMRYWGRDGHEEMRKCPGCGRGWRTKNPVDNPGVFWQFPFQCKTCRLVSHMACSLDDARHARIGEWKGIKMTQAKASGGRGAPHG